MQNVNILKALADESRQLIIKELKNGEKCACVILETLNISQSTLSHHMKILQDAGLVTCRKEGKWCHYSINNNTLSELNNSIVSLKQKPEYYDEIIKICLNEKTNNPIEIFNKLATLPYFGMLGIFHHVLVGTSLLCAYKNCGKDIDLKKSIIELEERAEKIPPMACVKLGACGAAISAGIFLSIVKNVELESNEFFGLANGLTSKVLNKIKENGGPRCCKRHSYFSLLEAAKYSNEHLGTNMKVSEIQCIRSKENKLCIGKRCPFNQS